jgi:hypothetical protein
MFSQLLTDLDLHHPPCLALVANQALSTLAALACNALTALKLSELPAEHHGWRVRTLIRHLPNLPAKLSRHARGGAAGLCAGRPPRMGGACGGGGTRPPEPGPRAPTADSLRHPAAAPAAPPSDSLRPRRRTPPRSMAASVAALPSSGIVPIGVVRIEVRRWEMAVDIVSAFVSCWAGFQAS